MYGMHLWHTQWHEYGMQQQLHDKITPEGYMLCTLSQCFSEHPIMAQQTIELQSRLDAVNEKNNSVILSAFREVHRRFATFCGHSEPLHFNTLLCLRNDLACHVYKEYASVHPLRIDYGDFVRHALHAFNLMDGHISILALQGNPSDGSQQERQFMSFISESLSNWCPTHQLDNIDCIAHHCFVSKLNTDTVG